MTGQQIRNSIFQEAIQGRLVSNVLQPREKTGAELLQEILAERQKKENEEKGTKARRLTLSIIDEEPYELPEGWCWCRIGDIADIERGGNFAKSDFVERGYPCIHYGQIHMKFGPRTYSVLSYLSDELATKQRKAHSGDIVMAVTSENIEDVCKCTAWLGDHDVAIGAHTAIIRHYIDPVFLVYYFKSSHFYSQKKDLGHGSKVIEVTPVSLNDVTLPLPPLSIQKSIVKRIEELLPLVDEYDKAAEELKTLNTNLPDKLRKSVLQEAIHGTLVSNDIPEGETTAPGLLQQILKERQDRENKEKGKKAKKLSLSTIEEEPWELPEGWCWCKLGDVFEMQAGKNINACEIHETQSVDYPYPCYGGNGIRGYVKSFNTEGTHTIVGRQGALCGNVKYAEGPFYATEHAVVVSMVICDVMWSYHFLIACDLNQYATKTAQPGLSVAKILDTYFPLPPLSIQHRIVEKIEEVFAAINKLESDNKAS